MFVGLLIVILPINIFLIIGAQLFNDAVKEQSYLEAGHALNLYMEQIDSQMETMTASLINESSNMEYIQVAQPNKTKNLSQYNYVKSQVVFRNKLSDLIRINTFIDGAFGYFEHENLMILQGNQHQDNENIRQYIIEYIMTKKTSENNLLLYWQPIKLNNEYYLFYLKEELDSYNGAWINVNQLMNKLKVEYQGIDYLNMLEYKNQLLSTQHTYEYIDNDYHIYDSEGNKKILDYFLVEYENDRNLKLMQFIPQNYFLESLPKVAKALMIGSIIGLIAIPIIIIIINRQVIRPINALLKAIRHINQGDLDYRIQEEAKTSEFYKINSNFNGMMNQIKALKIDVYESQIEKQRIKIEYLNHQVQPHFILNTLNIVYSYEKDEYDLIQDMIMNLIKYFRYIVRVNASFVILNFELDYIQTYLDIQQIRYPNSFSSDIYCDEALKKCLIPPLMIQNFVENAFKNAFDLDQPFRITVEIFEIEHEQIQIIISDTGQGFSPEVLKAINNFTHDKKSLNNLGVGIQNTMERLKYLYNTDPKIMFSNRENGGAVVTIILPKHAIEELEDV
jgi:sensor histidine kinase YesM